MRPVRIDEKDVVARKHRALAAYLVLAIRAVVLEDQLVLGVGVLFMAADGFPEHDPPEPAFEHAQCVRHETEIPR